MNLDKLRAQLIAHEGLRLTPYHDTVGKLTIGVGRNLDDRGISDAEALLLLDNDIVDVCAHLDAMLSWWRKLDDARQRVLADMCFNLGIGRLLTFKRALRAMQFGNFQEAAHHMLSSQWARQVGRRAKRLARMMETGEDL